MSDWRALLVDDDDGLIAIFRESKTVAVLGAKISTSEPAYYVPAYLHSRGYRIRPVNPRFAGRPVHDAETVAALRDLGEPAGHADEILALSWRPKTVWFQLGIRNDEAAEKLARAGIRVVQDRCMMPEHRRLTSKGL